MCAKKTVVFLDIDGVLNREHINYGDDDWPVCCHEPKLCANLQSILDKAGAEIVVSSAWREDDDLKSRLPIILAGWGIGHMPVGYTTTDSLLVCKLSDHLWYAKNRASQILQYVSEHTLGTWIAIDDLPLPLPDEHFVHTHPRFGLTQQKAVEAIDKLTRNSNNVTI